MTTGTPIQLEDSIPHSVTPPGPWLRVARLGALVFMAFCIVTFVWGLLLFPRDGLSNLDAIRPNDNWSDATLLAVIAEAGLSVTAFQYYQLALTTLLASCMVGIGLIIFWRKADSWFGLYLSVLFVAFGTQGRFLTSQVGDVMPLLIPVLDALGTLIWLAFFPLLYLFPDGRFIPRWSRWLLVAWLVVTVGVFSLNLLPEAVAFVAVPIYLVIGIGSQGYRYFRRSDTVQRQQTKWVFVSLGLVVLTAVWALVFLALSPPAPLLKIGDFWISAVASTLFSLSLALLPISIGMAILRYRLWDIDVVIRKTLQYTAVTALLAFIYFGSVFLLQRLFSSVSGQQSPLALVVSTLLIAALFAPLRRRIQDGIDRRFYRRKYNAQQVLAQFARTARDETDMEALLIELERVIQETLQPEGVKVWLKPAADRRRMAVDGDRPSLLRTSPGSER